MNTIILQDMRWQDELPLAIKVMEVASYRHVVIRHVSDSFTDNYLTIRKWQIKKNASVYNMRFKTVIM